MYRMDNGLKATCTSDLSVAQSVVLKASVKGRTVGQCLRVILMVIPSSEGGAAIGLTHGQDQIR